MNGDATSEAADDTFAAFAKDFGYLLPFIDRVAAAAGSIADAGAREELGRLVAGEKERWERIAAILRGARPTSTAARGKPAEPGATPEAEVPRAVFTVGSLRPPAR